MVNRDKVSKRRFDRTTSCNNGSVHDLVLADMLAEYGVPATFYIAKGQNTADYRTIRFAS
jgi:hypothetical protein